MTQGETSNSKILQILSISGFLVRPTSGGQVMSTQILVNELGISAVGISKRSVWAGRIISALPAVFLLSSGIDMSMKASFVMEGFAHLGYPERVALGIGIVEFICAALYVIRR